MAKKTIPKHICQFRSVLNEVNVGETEVDFSGIAYSGEMIEDHWGLNIVIDLSTMEVPNEMPLLWDHNRWNLEGTIGRTTEARVGNDLSVRGVVYGDTETGKKIVNLFRHKHPFQMSGYFPPRIITEVAPGEQVEVNGRMFTGPFEIWSRVQAGEVSLTTIGADNRTSAAAMAEDKEGLTVEVEGGTMPEKNQQVEANQGAQAPPPIPTQAELAAQNELNALRQFKITALFNQKNGSDPTAEQLTQFMASPAATIAVLEAMADFKATPAAELQAEIPTSPPAPVASLQAPPKNVANLTKTLGDGESIETPTNMQAISDNPLVKFCKQQKEGAADAVAI